MTMQEFIEQLSEAAISLVAAQAEWADDEFRTTNDDGTITVVYMRRCWAADDYSELVDTYNMIGTIAKISDFENGNVL